METIDNIIAEMRILALIDEESDEMVTRKHMSLALSTYASRIEAAAKALIADRDNWRDQAFAEAALAEPLRNCDIGTAEEQAERFKAFCGAYPLMCNGCPLKYIGSTYGDCTIHWSQMPYEEVKK